MAIAVSTVLVLVLSVSALAASSLVKDIRVQMGGIQVIVKGKPLVMKDATGATVEPIIYNGTTYLPVRSVAESVGLDVDWDGKTDTVSLGGKTVTYLDELPATNFESTTTGLSSYKSVGKFDGFSRALFIATGIEGDHTLGDTETTTLYYTLDGSYQRFLGAVDAAQENDMGGTIIRIYGDGALLYTSPAIVKEILAYEIDIDIADVSKLSIEFTSPVSASYQYSDAYRNIVLGEARLVK